MKIKVKKLKAEAVLPQMMRQGDAAFDLATCEDVLLKSRRNQNNSDWFSFRDTRWFCR